MNLLQTFDTLVVSFNIGDDTTEDEIISSDPVVSNTNPIFDFTATLSASLEFLLRRCQEGPALLIQLTGK